VTAEGLCTRCSVTPCDEHRTVVRLVCGNCGAFLPANISPETHADWLCRCGGDWFVSTKAFKVSPRRQERLPLNTAVPR